MHSHKVSPESLHCGPRDKLAEELRQHGFTFARAETTRQFLSLNTGQEWRRFTASWNDLGEDSYMADGGNYRRRRHAVFRLERGALTRLAHRPHYQSRACNPLNGGIERWFQPVTGAVGASHVLREVVHLCESLMAEETPRAFLMEMHQFRIAPSADAEARPTPEGMHRDGVDWACVLLVSRVNVTRSETTIADREGRALSAVTLNEPLDLIFLNDRRVAHGVAPIRRVNPDRPGFRDALVLTFSPFVTGPASCNKEA